MSAQDDRPDHPDVVLVTGASSGIGRASALRLAARGTRIVAGYHSGREEAEGLIGQLAGSDHMALRIAIDEPASIAEAEAAIAARYGKLDALVNSGGKSQTIALDALDELSDEIFDRIVAVNLRGPFAVIRAMRGLLEKGDNGAIVNVSSLAGQRGVGSNLAYCAAKGGLDTLTIGLARVLAPHIRVFSISPAGVDTGFVAGRSRSDLEAMAARMPLKKVTSADDVARAIVAAIVDLTSSTGIIINVDEGRHL